MPRRKRAVGIEEINGQIEKAEEEMILAKRRYDNATDRLKELLEVKKKIQNEELIRAVLNSKHSYEDILLYINSEIEE